MVNREETQHFTKIDIEDDQPRPIFETIPVAPEQNKEVFVADKADKDTSSKIEVEPVIIRDETFGTPPPLSSPEDFTPLPEIEEKETNHLKVYVVLGIVFFIVVASFVFLFNTLRKKITPKQVKLVYWSLWEDKPVMDPLITAYRKDHKNITIDYIKQSPESFREKVITQTKDGRGPDLFRFHNTWVPMLHDTLSPLPKNIMTNDEFEKTFYEIVREDMKVGNAYYGIPLYIDDLVLLYNNDFFKRVGITSPPKTWDELVTYAKQLTVPSATGDPVTSGIALGTAGNIEHFTDILGWMLLQNGADLKDVSSVEGEQVLKKYREFAEAPNPIWSEKMTNNVAAFQEGKVAMIFAPSWQIANIKAANSNLDMKVAELPVLPGESEPFSIANYWVEGVTRTSKHQKEAWEFLKYLSSRQAQTKLFELQVKARGLGSVSSRVDLKDTLLQNEILAPIISQAKYLKSIPTISRTFDNGLNDQINSYLEDAVNNAQNGVSYDEAMEKAQIGISSVLEKYNIK